MNGLEPVLRAIQVEEFNDNDTAAYIYNEMINRHSPIRFGSCLKDYIARKASIDRNASLDLFVDIILYSFRERGVPFSFKKSQTRPRAFAHSCLTRQSVSRTTVYLLGFGLGMSLDDVESFLTDALGEQGVRFKDPFEFACWYCFQYHFGFGKLLHILDELEKLPPAPSHDLAYSLTNELKEQIIGKVFLEEDFIRMLSHLKTEDGSDILSVTMKKEFDALYAEFRQTARQSILQNTGAPPNTEISPADMEHYLYPFIEKDRHGNLIGEKNSSFTKLFKAKRLTRQRIVNLNNRRIGVDRSDLITLYFHVFCHRRSHVHTNLHTVELFAEGMNAILRRCGLGEMNPNDPYEAFLLMCLAASDPIETMFSVYELSYASG